ncbi:MAG TPA: hypothetical protein DCM05_12865 [Elusimicrobia bacterium]|nr:hypothetical protein [Elusimicrobiota bacterium]
MKRTLLPVLLLSLSGCVTTKTYEKLKTESGAAQKQLAQTQAVLAEEQKKVEAFTAETAGLRVQLTEAGRELAQVKESFARASARAESVEKERDGLQQSNQNLSQSLGAKQDELSKTVTQLQSQLDESRKSLSIAQSRLADFEKRGAELSARLDQASAKTAALEKERGELLKSNADLSKSMNAKQDELSKTVTVLSNEKRGLEGRVAELSRAAEELKARQERELAQTKGTYESLVGELKGEIAQGQVKIEQFQGKLSVNVAETIFFDSGKAEIKVSGRKVLQRVGDVLKHVPDKAIRIEGHTDDVPIRSTLREKYPSNWELSTARATTVARFLQEKAGIDPALLTAAGYGEYRPVASNDAEDGRARNRRIEIVLIDREVGRAAAAP